MRFADGSSLLRHHFIRLGFLPSWKALVRPQAQEGTFRALEARLNEAAASRGELGMTVPMACIDAERRTA
jgi:hypothetical protein